MANTPESLDLLEEILAQINVVPHQVEIEAKFVAVTQTDLNELGFEWIFTDNYDAQPLQRASTSPKVPPAKARTEGTTTASLAAAPWRPNRY